MQQRRLCLLLFLFGVICLVYATGFTSIYINDVYIFSNETYWKCDRIECNEQAYYCHVTKRKQANDSTQCSRLNECLKTDKTVLQKKITVEKIQDFSKYKDVNLMATRTSIQSTSVADNVDAKERKKKQREALRKLIQQKLVQLESIKIELQEKVAERQRAIYKLLEEFRDQYEAILSETL